MPDSTDFIRFRRRRRKRWEINRDNARNSGDGPWNDWGYSRYSDFFTRDEWLASFNPRRRSRDSIRRKHKKRNKFRVRYPSYHRFRMKGGIHPLKTDTIGYWEKYVNGIQVPVFGKLRTPLTVQMDAAADIEKTWDVVHPGPPYRVGGPLTNIKINLPQQRVLGLGRYTTAPENVFNGFSWVYDGGFANPTFTSDNTSFSTYTASGISPWNNSLIPDVSGYGPRAYALLKPNPEQMNAGQFIAELRELPKALKSLASGYHDTWRTIGGDTSSPFMRPKWAADQFLGLEFGWLPFMRDIGDMFYITAHLQEFMNHVVLMNNTWQRRRRTIEETDTITPLIFQPSNGVTPQGIDIDNMCRNIVVNGTTCRRFYSLDKHEVSKVWAEGEFKFYRPEFDRALLEFDSMFMQLQRIFTLYGARITPTLIWKITPWTWLADWITKVGDNIDNISSMLVDSVVSKYMYVMRHVKREVRFSQSFNFWDRGLTTFTWSRNFETKQRAGQTSPFGFNVAPGSLTGMQWSILGAIGLSKTL